MINNIICLDLFFDMVQQHRITHSILEKRDTSVKLLFRMIQILLKEDVQQARFKEQRVQAPDCLEMDMRPGAMFQIAKEASQVENI